MQTNNTNVSANTGACNHFAPAISPAFEQHTPETSDEPAQADQKPLDKMSLRDILNRLTPPKLWGAMIALAGVISGAFYAGYSVKTFLAELEIARAERKVIESERKLVEAERNISKFQNDLSLLQIQDTKDKMELEAAQHRVEATFAISSVDSTAMISGLKENLAKHKAQRDALNAALRREKARKQALQFTLKQAQTKLAAKAQQEKPQANAPPKALDKTAQNVPPSEPNKPANK